MADESAPAASSSYGDGERTASTPQTAPTRAERAARNEERKAECARRMRAAEAEQQQIDAEEAADVAAEADEGGQERKASDDINSKLARAESAAAAAALRIAQLEQRLFAAEARSPGRQQQSPGQQQQQQQHPLSVPHAGGLHLQVKIDAVQVTLLKHATAGAQVPEWVFSMEKLQRQIASASQQQELPWDTVFQLAQQYWDKAMDDWWKGRESSARSGNGAHISSWSELVVALHADFVPLLREERAMHEMDRACQVENELVEAYLGRMSILHAHVRPERVPSHVFAEKVFRGLDSARYPFGHTSVAAQQSAEIAAKGRGFPFEVLRTIISMATMPEEQRQAQRKQQSHRGAPAEGAASQGRKRDTKQRISAVQAASAANSEDDMSTDDDGDNRKGGDGKVAMRAQISALTKALAAASSSGSGKQPRPGRERDSAVDGSRGRDRSKSRGDGRFGGQTRGGRCTKCGVKGHGRADCKSNKEVGCFGCGGDHLRQDCPADDVEGKPSSKN
jgi:hypothetical protein